MPINIWGILFFIGCSGTALIRHQRQESCRSFTLQKFWIVPTKDNSFVTSYKFCSMARTSILGSWSPSPTALETIWLIWVLIQEAQFGGNFPSYCCTFPLWRSPVSPGPPFLHTGNLRQLCTYFSLGLGSLSSPF